MNKFKDLCNKVKQRKAQEYTDKFSGESFSIKSGYNLIHIDLDSVEETISSNGYENTHYEFDGKVFCHLRQGADVTKFAEHCGSVTMPETAFLKLADYLECANCELTEVNCLIKSTSKNKQDYFIPVVLTDEEVVFAKGIMTTPEEARLKTKKLNSLIKKVQGKSMSKI
jgi:disulfide oxidoreductase YuzD